MIIAIKQIGNSYLILVEKEEILDRLTVRIEVGPEVFRDDTRPLNALKEGIRKTLQPLHPLWKGSVSSRLYLQNPARCCFYGNRAF